MQLQGKMRGWWKVFIAKCNIQSNSENSGIYKTIFRGTGYNV